MVIGLVLNKFSKLHLFNHFKESRRAIDCCKEREKQKRFSPLLLCRSEVNLEITLKLQNLFLLLSTAFFFTQDISGSQHFSLFHSIIATPNKSLLKRRATSSDDDAKYSHRRPKTTNHLLLHRVLLSNCVNLEWNATLTVSSSSSWVPSRYLKALFLIP